MKTAAGIVAAAVLGSGVLALHVPVVRADTPATINIAIPTNVEVVVGVAQVHIIGRPTSVSPVNCSPGTPFPQSAVVRDSGGAHASQITGILNFHDHEIPNGTRYQITAGPDACNPDFQLYTGTLE